MKEVLRSGGTENVCWKPAESPPGLKKSGPRKVGRGPWISGRNRWPWEARRLWEDAEAMRDLRRVKYSIR